MKNFFSDSSVVARAEIAERSDGGAPIYSRARVAVYDGPASAPYVEEIDPAPAREFIERLSVRVYELARARGGEIPYTVVREVSENFIHADFAEPVVSVLDDGRTIRFSDQGPGIPDKTRALQPGFTTASGDMKQIIRGVGSGLPIVKEFLSVTGGHLLIEDNLERGSVVTVTSSSLLAASSPVSAPVRDSQATPAPLNRAPVASAVGGLFGPPSSERTATRLRLTTRQKQVLALVMESGSAGPSIVSRELGVGLSTAYRDLASLEDLGLISSDGGKRALTQDGMSYLDDMTSSNS